MDIDFEFHKRMREESERRSELIKTIASEFKDDDHIVLFTLFESGFDTITPSELEKCGFKTNSIIQSNTAKDDPFMGRIRYYQICHYREFDLVWQNNDRYKIVRTDNSAAKAEQLNKIRDKKIEIEGFEGAAAAYIQDWEIRDKLQSDEFKEKARISSEELKLLIDQLNNIK
jgi:hypothetical protein